uniref:Uncharacterized protein n=1 Tax=Glossina morsitans morsitans TaxID=37546 RepID=A0A1B0GGF0_GLOMM
MVNYQVQVVVFLAALLGAHEVKGLSMSSSETAITTLHIGIFLSGLNYYCQAIRSARQENAVEDETIANKSTIMEMEKDNEKISKINTDYSSNLTANVNAVETSLRSSKVEKADIDKQEKQKVEKNESIGKDARSSITNLALTAKKKTVRSSKELRTYK